MKGKNSILLGIPIDMVGGTSMGSFVAAAYAINSDLAQTVKLTNKVSQVPTIVIVLTSLKKRASFITIRIHNY